jgi:hypothetical protein
VGLSDNLADMALHGLFCLVFKKGEREMRFKWPLMWRSTYDKAKALGDETFSRLRREKTELAIQVSELELQLKEARKNDHRDERGRFTRVEG